MFLRYNFFTILWAILILVLTVTPGTDMPKTDIWDVLAFDKIAHLFVFAVFVLLMIVGFSKQYRYLYFRYNAVRLALAMGLAYGLLIEIVQALIPERTLEYSDILADSLGCGIGYAIFYWVYKT